MTWEHVVDGGEGGGGGQQAVPELRWKQVVRLWDKSGALVDLWQEVHLEVGGEGVRQAHVAGEGRQDEVAHLDAAGRDDIAQLEVVLTQELREVMQQHQQHPQSALQHHIASS